MAQHRVVVKGYRELVRACTRADSDTKKYMRDTFRKVGDTVKVDAAGKFAGYDAKSAAGFRTRVRQRGVEVEQRLPRVRVPGPAGVRHDDRLALSGDLHARQTAALRQLLPQPRERAAHPPNQRERPLLPGCGAHRQGIVSPFAQKYRASALNEQHWVTPGKP